MTSNEEFLFRIDRCSARCLWKADLSDPGHRSSASGSARQIAGTLYRLTSGSDATCCTPPRPDVQAAVDAPMATISTEHGLEPFADELVAPPGESITRWLTPLAHTSPPDSGRPALTLKFEDVANDTYERVIPTRPRRAC
jgi:hypothetical protein